MVIAINPDGSLLSGDKAAPGESLHLIIAENGCVTNGLFANLRLTLNFNGLRLGQSLSGRRQREAQRIYSGGYGSAA